MPLQGSNLDFPDPESGVLPVTPRGNDAGVTPRPVPSSRVYFSTGKEIFFQERETGLEPATLSLGS